MDLFKGSHDIFDEHLRDMFIKPKDTEMDLILKTVSLLIYKNCNNIDIIELYRLVGLETFTKIIMLFDGRSVKFPSKKEISDNLIYSLVYYYKEIQGLSWEKIKEKFPFEISGISCGIQIKQLDNFMRQNIESIYKEMEKINNESKN